MAETGYWRTPAPVWLRFLLGLLVLPVAWLALTLLFDMLGSALPEQIVLLGAVAGAGLLSWLIVAKASKRWATGLAVLTVLGYGLVLAAAIPSYQAYKPDRPQAEVPGGEGSGAPPDATLPEFPWPPPKASASYVLPASVLEEHETVGDATGAILAALERNGYVERSFFRTEDGGIALVTRLERITSDGYSYPANRRWPGKGQTYASKEGLFQFLRGLFYVDPGHYRVIVFVLQDLPFAQSSETAAADEAKAWLASGANHLPVEIAARGLGEARGTVLVYEFASDGRTVEVIESALTGKDHLENAGVLAELDNAP